MFVAIVERKFSLSLKKVQIDERGEFGFLSNSWQAKGLIQKITCPYTSKKWNGKVKKHKSSWERLSYYVSNFSYVFMLLGQLYSLWIGCHIMCLISRLHMMKFLVMLSLECLVYNVFLVLDPMFPIKWILESTMCALLGYAL